MHAHLKANMIKKDIHPIKFQKFSPKYFQKRRILNGAL